MAARKLREIIAVRDKDGRVTIRQRGADSVAVRSGAGAMNAVGGEEITEPEPAESTLGHREPGSRAEM